MTPTIKQHAPRIQIISSFHQPGYQYYGRRFLDSYAQYVSSDLPLIVMAEGFDTLPESPASHIAIRALDHPEMQAFHARHKDVPSRNGMIADLNIRDQSGKQLMRDYRYEAVRFSKKVFALTDPSLSFNDVDIRIWLDADVRFCSNLDSATLASYLNLDVVLNYLGRKNWDHSECGFVSYYVGGGASAEQPSKQGALGRLFLQSFRKIYMEDSVFKLSQWHDSFVFDTLRIANEKIVSSHSISADAVGNNVWPQTWLSKFMYHDKGHDKFKNH